MRRNRGGKNPPPPLGWQILLWGGGIPRRCLRFGVEKGSLGGGERWRVREKTERKEGEMYRKRE